jgi:hypothetical protein
MAEEINTALDELRNLEAGCKAYNANKRATVSALDLLKLGSVTNGQRTLPSILVTANEGGSLRVLKFAFDKTTLSYLLPKDITGTFEYARLAGDSGTAVQLPKIPGTSDSYPRYLFAYPGQKANTVYGCNDLKSSELCTATCTGRGIYRNDGADKVLSETGKDTSRTYDPNGLCIESGTDKYYNPVSGVTEHNPRLCCSSKLSSSKDGKCLEAPSDCYLTAAGQKGTCNSASCSSLETSQCLAANTLSGSDLFTSPALLVPYSRCTLIDDPEVGKICDTCEVCTQSDCGTACDIYKNPDSYKGNAVCGQAAASPSPLPSATPTATPTSSAYGAKPGVSVKPFGPAVSCYVQGSGSQTACLKVAGAENCMGRFYVAGNPVSAENYVCSNSPLLYNNQCFGCNAQTEACLIASGAYTVYYCRAFCKTQDDCAGGFTCTVMHPGAANSYGICKKAGDPV